MEFNEMKKKQSYTEKFARNFVARDKKLNNGNQKLIIKN